jgi:serine/threonine protein kinase
MASGSDAHVLTDPVSSAACPKCGALLDVAGLPAFTAVQCPTCEFEFQVPARFGSFLLLQMLGAGGMGGVYRARDEALNREVAIKVMLKSLGDDPHFVETFQREAQAAAKLNNPHIAQIYSFGQEHGQPYIVMELVSGGSLDKMLAAQGRLDPASVIHIGAQIAEGLSEAADAGLVHGDVKPENILFDNDKNAKLVDFGLAALNGGPGNDVWGTPFYIAPEKVRRQKADFRADIYSLGATLYHAIAGVPPFDGSDATAVVKARFDGPPKPLKEIRGKVIVPEVEALIARMLAVEPQMRYPTYGSLLGDMRRYLSSAGPVQLQLGGNTKKFMIKGKTQKGATQKSATGMTVSTGSISEIPPGMTPVDQIPEEEETDGTASKKRLKKIAVWAGAALLLIVLGVGVVFGVKAHLASQQAKAEAAQIEKKQASAKSSIAKSVSNAKVVAERTRVLVPEAIGYAKSGADAVVEILGEGVRASMIPPEPEYAAAQPVAPAVPVVAAAAAATTNKVAGAGGSNTVAAAVSNAVPKAAVAAVSNAAPKAAVAAAPVAAADQPAADAPQEGEHKDPTIEAVRGMYEAAYAVKQASLTADALLAEIEAQAKTAEGKLDPKQTGTLIRLANALVDKAGELSHTREIADAPRKVAQLKKTLASVKTGLASLAEKKRQEIVEKEKKAKEDALAAKKQQEQEAHQAKIQSECARVAATEIEAVAPLKQLQFRDALRVLKDLTDGLETKEGLDALNLATERVNRVKDFHQYLVEKVPGYKSARGWTIEHADQKTLTVAGKKIQWIEVYSSRLDIVAELVRGLVMDEQAIKALKLSEKAKLMTNAALCLTSFYKDMPSAQEFAKQLATAAAQQFDAGAENIKQLMPAFFVPAAAKE